LRVFRSSIVIAAAAAILLTPACRPSLWGPLVRIDGYRRRDHARELQYANLGDVRAGGDCGQPRLLHSEPALAGPAREVRQPGGRRKRVDYWRRPPHPANESGANYRRASGLSYLGAQFLPGDNERALMKIFRGKTRKIRIPRASASLI